MWQAAYPFFAWHQQIWMSKAIQDSVYAFPIIETIHILAMAVMFGCMLVMNIKLMRLGFKRQPITLLSKTLLPAANVALLVMLATGYMMFSSEAIKDFSNDGFKFKMASLALALIFQVTLYRSVVRGGDDKPAGLRIGSALACFLLWFCVGVGGRAIGFV